MGRFKVGDKIRFIENGDFLHNDYGISESCAGHTGTIVAEYRNSEYSIRCSCGILWLAFERHFTSPRIDNWKKVIE